MMGLLGGGVIWIISVLKVGIGDVISNLLLGWLGYSPYFSTSANSANVLNDLLSVTWLLAVIGGLLVWAIIGGLAVLRHAVLRLLLWRSHTFPWQAAPFLKDARARILVQRVGGGYRFVHRLLLDYFADLQAGTSAPSPPTAPPP